MKLHELHDQLEAAFEYPVDQAIVLDTLGEERIDAPDAVDSMTIKEILASDSDKRYETADDLFESLLGNLDEEYIGRKYYDDRGMNIEPDTPGAPHDERDQSF